MYVKTLTYSMGNLGLVIDAAALGVVVSFILNVAFETLAEYGFRLHIRVVVFWLLGPRLVGYRWRNLAEPVPGIPDLEHDIEGLLIDLPKCTAQNVQASICKFKIA